MTTRWKRVGIAISLLAGAGLACIVGDQAVAAAAYHRFRDIDWRRTATRDQTRRTAELALGWRFGHPHDEFLVLQEIGDASSVPYIRAALRRKPSGGGSCAWAHGEEALERLCATDGAENR